MNNKHLITLVAKILVIAKAERATRDAHPEARSSGRKRATFDLARSFLIDDARFAHFRVEIVALTRSLADTGENREPAVLSRCW